MSIYFFSKILKIETNLKKILQNKYFRYFVSIVSNIQKTTIFNFFEILIQIYCQKERF